ncbi:MAG: serine/threonine-protein phosphatase, partial [bacterium]|nr:serine/threonine-protein phosphatase [bacterium]
EVGGDYYDIIPLEGNRAFLVVADVSGKGAGAALLMSNIQAGLRSMVCFSSSLEDIADGINNIIYSNTSSSQFITLFMGLWDGDNGKMEYVNAGHNPALLIQPGGNFKKLVRTGIALGIKKDVEYSVETVDMHPDDLLAIYSDGIEETFNSESETFGMDRIIETLRQNTLLSAWEIGEALFNEARDFAGGIPREDDLTLIIAKGSCDE